MDFTLSSDQQALIDTAIEFREKEMMPYAATWDEQHIFPVDTLKKAASLGFAGLYIHENIGGSHLSRVDSALLFETLSYACPSTAAYLSIHNMVAAMIDHYGSEEQRSAFIPSLLTMECLASYCLTEPGSGSDAASLKTSAKREGDFYIVNGTKAFISGGSRTDLYAVMVRTGDASHKGISCLLIDKNTPGISFGKLEKKLGWHSQPTTMVFFENCKVPVKNRLGDEGIGFKIALKGLNGGRINIAACSLGGAKACIDAAQKYMTERKQFGKTLSEFQALQFKVADMVTNWEAARLLVYKAADALDKSDPNAPQFCAMAKRFATDIGFQICDEALQLFGGYGYLQDYPIERYLRDLRVHRILEGSNEIMRMIIARELFNS